MKRNHLLSLAICTIALLITACRFVEVSSMPRTFTIAIQSEMPALYQLCQLKASGAFERVKPASDGIYTVSIPVMDGGYSEFLFIKYNKHIPEEYPVIRITKNGIVQKELSIADMKKLPVKDGRIQLRPE